MTGVMGRIALIAGLCLCASVAAQPVLTAGEARLAGLVTDPAIDEISGFAASRVHPGILWTHNDSGGTPTLYAIDSHAARRAKVEITNVSNFDWEDMAAFRYRDRDWLLIADTGDNGGIRRQMQLHIVPEPTELADGVTEAVRTIEFAWPDGARDCEAVGVDATSRSILLVSKKRVPPELYRISLDADSSAGPVVAERIGLIRFVNQPSLQDLQRNPVYGRYRAQISGMDISSDGRRMVVLNYLSALIYLRGENESWSDAVRHRPIPAPFPWVTQAEAVAFSPSGDTLWIGSEILPAPLLQIRLLPR